MNKVKVENGIIENDIPYFMVPNEIFDKKIIIKDNRTKEEREMDCQETLIFIFLLRCCNGGKKAFPSYKYIADRCKCSKRKAMYSIDNLYLNKFIIKKKRGNIEDIDGNKIKSFSNIYKINHKKLKEIC